LQCAHNEMRPYEDTNSSVVGLGKRSGAKSSLNKTVTWCCGSDKTRAVGVMSRLDDGEQVELMFDDEVVDGS